MSDPKKKIISFIKTQKPRSSEHKILSNDSYVGGFVSKVEYVDNSKKITQWIIITKQYSGHADNESQLIQQMEVASNKNNDGGWISRMFNISGLIALVLVATASYLFIVKDAPDIPESLKTILLTIVGFYFGGLVKQKQTTPEKP